MTHWSNITRKTREFTDESYKPLHTPSEYFYTAKQKEEMRIKDERKAQLERDRKNK